MRDEGKLGSNAILQLSFWHVLLLVPQVAQDTAGVEQPGSLPRLRRGPSLAGWKEPRPLRLEDLPVDQRRQLMLQADHIR